MNTDSRTMAQQVADAVTLLQTQRTGHTPKAITVVLSHDTLVVTLHDALTPAEKVLSRTEEGAAKVQEFHRQLFHGSVAELREEIKRITGVQVREAAVEVETKTGTIVHAFTNGAMVQVFQLARGLSDKEWNSETKSASPPTSEVGMLRIGGEN